MAGFPGVSLMLWWPAPSRAQCAGGIPRHGFNHRCIHDPAGAIQIRFYVNYPPQLFDLKADPEELTICGRPAYAEVLKGVIDISRNVDPVEVDARVKLLRENCWQPTVPACRHCARDLGYSPPRARNVFDRLPIC